MGGGGLDYYDPQLLLAFGTGTTAVRPSDEKLKRVGKELAETRAEVEALGHAPQGLQKAAEREAKLAAARQKLKRLRAELARLNDPAANGPVALGVRDAKTFSDAAIRIRGEAEKHGPLVPRGFLSVVAFPGEPVVNVKQSGRLELAQWLSSPRNPLVSRVMVNRVWHHLFGTGLVKSVDNFGVTGEPPSHPELLDHLATRFIHDGWSIKRLVRSIVLTRAYRMSSGVAAENLSVDPDNRLVWRHNPRRLDAEEIRDATLAAAGQLDLSRTKGSPAMDLPVIELANNGPQARRLAAAAAASRHRSVYLPLLRGLTPNSLAVFDFAEQGMVTGGRDTTMVGARALYLLNDPFVRVQSEAFAVRLLRSAGLSDTERIDLAFRIALGRSATAAETSRVRNISRSMRSR